MHDNCIKTETKVGCASCGRDCCSFECFKRHKRAKMVQKTKIPAACELWNQCKKCRVKLSAAKRNPKLNVCGEWECSSCSDYHLGEHLCFQKSYISDPEDREKKIIFYDFETSQDHINQCEQGYNSSCIRCRECAHKEHQCANCRLCRHCQDPSCGLVQHKVNFAVLQTSCHHCENEELKEDSKCSGKRCASCSKMKSLLVHPVLIPVVIENSYLEENRQHSGFVPT